MMIKLTTARLYQNNDKVAQVPPQWGEIRPKLGASCPYACGECYLCNKFAMVTTKHGMTDKCCDALVLLIDAIFCDEWSATNYN